MTTVLSRTRTVPGHQWLSWYPAQQALARVALRAQLRQDLRERGLVATGKTEVVTRYDELHRRVILFVEVQAVPA